MQRIQASSYFHPFYFINGISISEYNTDIF